jgi:prepilin-type N-terminal cleavage/methylation domain-containing protein
MKPINKKAFTLAEVLISLSIMGVVFASLSGFISRYFIAGNEIYNNMERISDTSTPLSFPSDVSEILEIWDTVERLQVQSSNNITQDESNNLYVSDTLNHRIISIQKKTSSGKISSPENIEEIFIIAGTGIPGLSGNGGRADLARVSSPMALYYHQNLGKEFLYFLDTGNNILRKIEISATIPFVYYITGFNKDSIEEVSFSDEGSRFLVDSSRNEIRMKEGIE